jgi:hypothetical protein
MTAKKVVDLNGVGIGLLVKRLNQIGLHQNRRGSVNMRFKFVIDGWMEWA